MKTYKPITLTEAAKNIEAYVVMHPSGNPAAVVHVSRSRGRTKGTVVMRIDVIEDYVMSAQISTTPEDYPFTTALHGVKVADVKLFGADVPIGSKSEAIKPHETTHYIAGLDRLKIAGYQIIKVI